MKIISAFIVAFILILIPSQKASASHFSCSEIVPQTTSVTMQVQSTAINTEFVMLLKSTTPSYSDAINSASYTLIPPDKKVYVFEDLEPASTYRALVFNGLGAFVEDIKGCSFTTKTTSTTTTGTTGGQFRIDITKQGTTQATISVRSLLEFDTNGRIEISKPSDPSFKVCNNMAFPSGLPAVPCTVIGLTTGVTYTAKVISQDSAGTYQGTKQFDMGTATVNQNSTTTTTTNQTTTSTTQQGSTAQSGTSSQTGSGTATSAGGNFVPGGQATGFQLDVRLQNPLKVDNIKDAVKFFVDTLIRVAIPFIVIFFIWAGLKFILAQGKPDKITEAKKMFWYTIVGTLLILGAWTITNAIIGTVNSITG